MVFCNFLSREIYPPQKKTFLSKWGESPPQFAENMFTLVGCIQG